MKVRVLYNPDKTVAVIHPAPKSRKKDETEAVWLERVFSVATPKDVTYEDIDETELPKTREHRESWEGEIGKGVFVNDEKVVALAEEKTREDLISAEKEKIIEALAIASLTKQGLI